MILAFLKVTCAQVNAADPPGIRTLLFESNSTYFLIVDLSRDLSVHNPPIQLTVKSVYAHRQGHKQIFIEFFFIS